MQWRFQRKTATTQPGCGPKVIAINFFLPSFFIRENPSGRIVGTARLIVAFREPRERYQEGDAKVVAVGFIFALETLGF